MKIRQGFVSNSSSSSFIVVNAGKTKILEEDGYDESGYASMDIDEMIKVLSAAKEEGATTVSFEFGGRYDG
jgi:hypothetical protein